MNRELLIFIIVLVINLLVTLAYYLIERKKRPEDKLIYRTKSILMILCPIAGPISVFFSWFVYKVFFQSPVDLEDVIFSKDKTNSYVHADEERGRVAVSMEEALAVSDDDNLRTLMLNVVRGDISTSLNSIFLALNSEDSETSHYAASVLQDWLNDFRSTVQNSYNIIKDCVEKTGGLNDQAINLVQLVIKYMDVVLKQNVFTEMEQKSFVSMLDEVCEILYENNPKDMVIEFYETVCLRLIEISDFDKSKIWCRRVVQDYPNELSTYTCQLRLYYANGDKENFFKVMEKLKHSNIVIDNETLEIIRAFM